MTAGLTGLAGAWVGVGEAPSVVEGLGELVATGGSESAVSKAPAANMPRGAMIATAARTATPAVAARRRRIVPAVVLTASRLIRSEEHTSELQSLMRISYAVFCSKKKKKTTPHT